MAKKGITWVNDYHGRASDLSNNDTNAKGFYSTLSGTKEYEYGNDMAWDTDFEQTGVGTPISGHDTVYADNVDIAFFSGHGSINGLMFGVATNDDGQAKPSEMKLGDKNLEWLIADACQVLDRTDVFNRMGGIFNGLHYILGFHTVCSDDKDRGEEFADRLNDGKTIRKAWLQACAETEGSSTECAYMRADNATSDTSNDHWHGKGTVSPDPDNPTTFAYLKTTC